MTSPTVPTTEAMTSPTVPTAAMSTMEAMPTAAMPTATPRVPWGDTGAEHYGQDEDAPHPLLKFPSPLMPAIHGMLLYPYAHDHSRPAYGAFVRVLALLRMPRAHLHTTRLHAVR